jgi:hypothetical protein
MSHREKMIDTIKIEAEGRKILEAWLKENGREFRASDQKTYDLIVDGGSYAELKAGTQSFVPLTGPQYRGLVDGTLELVFYVDMKTRQVTEYSREQLLAVKPKHYESYEFPKTKLNAT